VVRSPHPLRLDVDRSIAFFAGRLGFAERWRHAEDGRTLVAQVDRTGCELILSSQEPEKTGRGRMFIPLNVAVLEEVRSELETGESRSRTAAEATV
jgi:hypothetical protein